jgi:hypothetical protein
MQAFWSSWLCADAVPGISAKNAKAIAILIFMIPSQAASAQLVA